VLLAQRGVTGQECLPDQPGEIDVKPVLLHAVLERTAVVEDYAGERRLVRLDRVYVDPVRFEVRVPSAERRALKAARDRGRANSRTTFNREAPPSRRSA
jgi:hypothetical protein